MRAPVDARARAGPRHEVLAAADPRVAVAEARVPRLVAVEPPAQVAGGDAEVDGQAEARAQKREKPLSRWKRS